MFKLLNECFDCETWFNGFSKKELAKIVVKAIIAGAFLFSVLFVLFSVFGGQIIKEVKQHEIFRYSWTVHHLYGQH